MASLNTNYNVVFASSSGVLCEKKVIQTTIKRLKGEFKNDCVTFSLNRRESDVDPEFRSMGVQGEIDE